MFTMDELVDNYVTFLVAGGDPTAHTITFAIYEIVSLLFSLGCGSAM